MKPISNFFATSAVNATKKLITPVTIDVKCVMHVQLSSSSLLCQAARITGVI